MFVCFDRSSEDSISKDYQWSELLFTEISIDESFHKHLYCLDGTQKLYQNLQFFSASRGRFSSKTFHVIWFYRTFLWFLELLYGFIQEKSLSQGTPNFDTFPVSCLCL
jgi:hypothetical protein